MQKHCMMSLFTPLAQTHLAGFFVDVCVAVVVAIGDEVGGSKVQLKSAQTDLLRHTQSTSGLVFEHLQRHVCTGSVIAELVGCVSPVIVDPFAAEVVVELATPVGVRVEIVVLDSGFR